MTGDKPPLAMTMGDPAGIGPELALGRLARSNARARRSSCSPRPAFWPRAAKRAGLAVPIIETDPAGAGAAFANGLPVVPLRNPVADAPGRPTQPTPPRRSN